LETYEFFFDFFLAIRGEKVRRRRKREKEEGCLVFPQLPLFPSSRRLKVDGHGFRDGGNSRRT
jgi:hypothetical protein